MTKKERALRLKDLVKKIGVLVKMRSWILPGELWSLSGANLSQLKFEYQGILDGWDSIEESDNYCFEQSSDNFQTLEK